MTKNEKQFFHFLVLKNSMDIIKQITERKNIVAICKANKGFTTVHYA